MWVVIQSPSGARALSTTDALSAWEGRGFTAVGGCSDPAREPLLTDTEQAAHDAAEAERIAALLKSDPASAASRPSK